MQVQPDQVPLDQARAYCESLAKTHYENFPVGRFVPKKIRPHIHAIYAFARTADDFADEAQHEGHRLERLAAWRQLLYDAAAGKADQPIFIALSQAIREHQIPLEWLDHLIQAFESDVKNNRHETFADLLAYSNLSANPVGRLVLWLHGYRDPKMLALSDHICTALQLANFWQDVAIDWRKDRVYLPQSELKKVGYTEAMLAGSESNEAFRRTMADLIKRTRAIFQQGKPLCDRVDGRLKLELRLVWSGGSRILEKIEAVNYDVFRRRPVIKAGDQALLLYRSLFWKREHEV